MIVHADSRQSLADLLRSQPMVTGFTFTHVEGHGAQDEFDPALSARDRVVGYTPRMRVDILLNDEEVDEVLQVLRADGCGLAGCGIFWITPLEQHGRL
ncbi:MAG: hypothetical protein A2X57_09410 [Nitrospirae bacterium GWD2_57_8]|nr:MAG: hypothetical protein A2X57_09410 [Nitrospirae bacterium GWD2_57_8]